MAVFSGNRQWVYPTESKGQFSRYHKVSSVLLFLILAVGPWLRWNGNPLLLADLPTRRMIVLGHIFTASDSILIMLFALTAAFTLFFVTTIWGRVWCGYACPQSVFMINLVFPIEAWIEGTRGQRMRANAGPKTPKLMGKKLLKWGIYLLIAWLIAMSFMGFFAPTELLWTGRASAGAYGVVAFFTLLWFWDFAWYREQVCNLVCPYARFQGALTDDDSWVISYDVPRGEPRGRDAKARGGCIDCNKCVVVCPQGIDIREGFQLECIACGRCVEACDSVMTKIGHETLVRYSTAANDEGLPRQGAVRPRTLAYGALLASLVAGIVYNVALHSTLEVQVDRAPGSLFVQDDDGYVRNMFMVHMTDRNVADGVRTYAVAVTGLPDDAQIRAQPIQMSTAERKSVPLIVRVPRSQAERTMPFTVRVLGTDVTVDHEMTFKGPGAKEF